MKKILFGSLFLFAAAATFFTCSNEEPKKLSSKKSTKLKYALKPDSIYREGSIVKALSLANENQKNESRKLFMTGLDLLVNKQNPKASIEYFKEAIYYYPDEKNYSHLFDAYLRNNELDNADSVNTALAGRIAYPEISFNYALIAAARKDEKNAVSNLEAACYDGFAFKDKIVNEKLFDFLKENQSFQSLMITYFGNDEKIRQTLFKAFLNSFPEVKLPFELSRDSAASFNYDKYINYDFAMFIPGMEDGRFSRDVSSEYMYVGKFKTESGSAVIYKVREMMADTLNPVRTGIAVYDSLGTLVSNETISCFCSPLESKSAIINKDMSIDVNVYTTKWENDPLEKGYAGNKVIGVDESTKLKFVLTRENKIEEVTNKESVASNQ